MDFNDIASRIKRIYNALDKRVEKDINSHIKTTLKKRGSGGVFEIRFGKFDETELTNRVFGIISAIAGIKDHLKKQMAKESKDPQKVEEMIDESEELSLIIDLWNQDKHGYPLKKKRSGKDPRIENIRQGLTLSSPTKKGSFTASFPLGTVRSSSNVIIKINADVVDGGGEKLMSLDSLIDGAVSAVEEFMKANGLNSSKE